GYQKVVTDDQAPAWRYPLCGHGKEAPGITHMREGFYSPRSLGNWQGVQGFRISEVRRHEAGQAVQAKRPGAFFREFPLGGAQGDTRDAGTQLSCNPGAGAADAASKIEQLCVFCSLEQRPCRLCHQAVQVQECVAAIVHAGCPDGTVYGCCLTTAAQCQEAGGVRVVVVSHLSSARRGRPQLG